MRLCLLVAAAAACGVAPWAGDPSPKPTRAAWTGSRVVGSPDPPPPYKFVNPFPEVKFDHPLVLAPLPGTDRLVVGEQGGKLFSFRNNAAAKAELFFDARAAAKNTLKLTPGATEFDNLYGVAFHPKFADNRFCYVCYTVKGKPKNLPEGSRVSRFKVTTADPPTLDPATEEVVFTYLQGGHNGGDLHFGPDGMLYVTTGDAADPNPPDPFRTGQDITDLLSSILRIDVDRRDPGKTYGVPKDNPFVGVKVGDKPARPEVWAYGFRNPWRMSFDTKTGDLWVGDVGWELWEMVHKIEKGGNYGWSVVEARQPVRSGDKPGPTPIRPPVIEIPHTQGASVTGGYVYRGRRFPELVGAYVFGDWETRRVWGARVEGDRLKSMAELADPTARAVAFGQDHAGELYVLDYDSGRVLTFAKNDASATDPQAFPRTLQATGLYKTTRGHALADGVYPFAVNARQWQDYATAEHFVALPGNGSITDYDEKKKLQGNRADWHSFRLHFPKDAVLGKTLTLDGKRVETQLLHFNGEDWRGYSYAWRDDQTDADLVPADGAEKEFVVPDKVFPGGKREQTWTFHSRSQCAQCHHAWSGYTLAFNHEQLNRDDQLVRLGDLGLLKRVGRGDKPRANYTPAECGKMPRVADPQGTAPLHERAQAYLHVNCGHCHRFGGGGAVDFELHREADIHNAKLKDAVPTRGTFGLPDARLIAAGDPLRSVVYYRMSKFGSGRMPQLGSEFPDEQGLALIRSWIGDLHPEPRTVKEFPENAVTNALARVRALGRPDLTNEQRAAVFSPRALTDPNTADLFEGYLPRTGERKLGQAPRAKAILAKAGDAARGQELFWSQKMTCQTCHKIDGKGTEVGPDLSHVGKDRTRDELLESVLDPSRRVEAAYQSFLVKTIDGQAYTGLLLKRDDKGVVLKGAQNQEITVAADNLESLQPARESLMPAGALADLTAQQAADLLEYLASRK